MILVEAFKLIRVVTVCGTEAYFVVDALPTAKGDDSNKADRRCAALYTPPRDIDFRVSHNSLRLV